MWPVHSLLIYHFIWKTLKVSLRSRFGAPNSSGWMQSEALGVGTVTHRDFLATRLYQKETTESTEAGNR